MNKKAAVVALLLALVVVPACSKDKKVNLDNSLKTFMTLLGDGKNMVMVGCKDVPAFKMDMNTVEELIPSLSKNLRVHKVLSFTEDAADEVCSTLLNKKGETK